MLEKSYPCKAHIEVVYFDREFSCELSDLFCIISDIVDKVYEDGVSPLSDDLEVTIEIGEFNTADVAYNVGVIVVLIVSVFYQDQQTLQLDANQHKKVKKEKFDLIYSQHELEK